jgi:hypothetical protein
MPDNYKSVQEILNAAAGTTGLSAEAIFRSISEQVNTKYVGTAEQLLPSPILFRAMLTRFGT